MTRRSIAWTGAASPAIRCGSPRRPAAAGARAGARRTPPRRPRARSGRGCPPRPRPRRRAARRARPSRSSSASASGSGGGAERIRSATCPRSSAARGRRGWRAPRRGAASAPPPRARRPRPRASAAAVLHLLLLLLGEQLREPHHAVVRPSLRDLGLDLLEHLVASTTRAWERRASSRHERRLHGPAVRAIAVAVRVRAHERTRCPRPGASAAGCARRPGLR